VVCVDGCGRTGTAIACIAQLAGVRAQEAVNGTREHYHRRAVKTPWQRRYARGFTSHPRIRAPMSCRLDPPAMFAEAGLTKATARRQSARFGVSRGDQVGVI
jgi:hypothetical protein